MDTDTITKPVAAVTAVMAMIGGGYSLYDKIKLPPKDILHWDAEHFSKYRTHLVITIIGRHAASEYRVKFCVLYHFL